MEIIIQQYPNDDEFHGDEATVYLNDDGSPHRAITYWDIRPFMAQLRERFPAPEGCEWRVIDVCHAQVVKP